MANAIEILSAMETELMVRIIRNLSVGNIGSAEWQVKQLARRGRVSADISDVVRSGTEEARQALIEELSRESAKARNVSDSMMQGTSLADNLPPNADEALKSVLSVWEIRGAEQINRAGANLLASANRMYVDVVETATAQVLSGDITGREAMRKISKQWADSGLPALTDAAGRNWTTEAYSQTIVRSNVRGVTTDTQLERAQQYGADLVEVSSHIGARPLCEPYQGKIFSISGNDKKYPPLSSTSKGEPAGLFGINCVIGGTLVSGPRKSATYRRKYSGEIITIRTASGHELTVTPNHPILTSDGWVPAHLLKEGGNVVSRTDFNRKASIGPNPYNHIAVIDKVFNSFFHRMDIIRLSSSSGDFHGDSTDSHVDVVFKDSLLRDRVKTFEDKEIKKRFLHSACKSQGDFFPFGALHKIFIGALHSSYGFVCVFRDVCSKLFSSSFMHISDGIGSAFGNRDAEFSKIPTNRSFGNAGFMSNIFFPHSRVIHRKKVGRGNSKISKNIVLPVFSSSIDSVSYKKIADSLSGTSDTGCYRHRRYAGVVSIDNIVCVERKSSVNSFIHVYNLETKDHWYYSNNIISHNCQHQVYPYFPGEERTFKPYPKSENDTAYQNSQNQRLLERNIRKAKREEALAKASGDIQAAAVARQKISNNQAAIRSFIDETGRTRRRDREQIS